MEWYHWVIIALIAYMVFWYRNPDQGKEYLTMGVDRVKSVVGDVNLPVFGGKTCDNTNATVCDYSTLTNYLNRCYAEKAGVKNSTNGACVIPSG